MKWLPKWLVNRLYPLPRRLEDIDVRPHQEAAARFALGAYLPYFQVWLDVQNRSYIDLALDRISLEVWTEQPFCEAFIGQIVPLSRRQRHVALGKVFLNQAQEEKVKAMKSQGEKTVRLTINGEAYFLSRLGLHVKRFQFQQVLAEL